VSTRTGNRTELARFLRSRREAVTPAQVGLPSGERRRTPGLRRDEVAELASMSTNYYESLEQARGPRPSPTVLAGIARGLRLSAEEREHLYLFAEQPLPAQDGRRSELDAGLVMTMESLTAMTIAMIVDDLGTVLAQNRLSAEMFGRLTDQTDRGDNMVWRWFTDPAWRASLAPPDTHDATAAGFVADLRALAAQRGDDPATARFIGELRAASDEFAHLGPARRAPHAAGLRVPAPSAGRHWSEFGSGDYVKAPSAAGRDPMSSASNIGYRRCIMGGAKGTRTPDPHTARSGQTQ
jgi:transcriptional regulator with XRE-family HTH domain